MAHFLCNEALVIRACVRVCVCACVTLCICTHALSLSLSLSLSLCLSLSLSLSQSLLFFERGPILSPALSLSFTGEEEKKLEGKLGHGRRIIKVIDRARFARLETRPPVNLSASFAEGRACERIP